MSIISYFKAAQEELKEVRFPSVNKTILYTVIVIVVSLITAAVLGGLDIGLKEGVARLLAR